MNHAGSHDPLLVTLSLFIAMVASYTALDLCTRARSLAGVLRYLWLLAAAVAMGGGIWAMHFVGMLAFHVHHVEFSYAFGLTALSFVLPIAAAALGFHVVARHGTRPLPLLASGAIMGIAIAMMHYTGMAAVRFPGAMHYHWPWVLVSIVIAVSAATVALWIANQNTRIWQRLAAAVLMGLAIAGMHYAAMQGLELILDSAVAGQAIGGMESAGLAGLVAGVTLLVLLLGTTAAAVDRHFAARSERDAALLRVSEERMRLLLKSVTDYAILMLDPGGHVSDWNTGAERINGYRAEEIVGAHFSRFYPPEDRDSGMAERSLRIAAEAGRFEHEGWLVRKDGSRFWANMVIEPVRNDAGALLGFVKVCRDITERKQAQEALEQAREALFQVQKMDAVGQLTGGVAHDFNNLLTAVLGSLELLRKRLPDDPRSLRLLENAVRGAERGAALTQRMLAFARRQDLRLEPVDVPALVRGMHDLFERTIGPAVQIETRFPLRPPIALADANQLELALLNLVVNARDAMPDGGTISISVDAAGTPPAELSERDYLCITVEDSGMGMPPETLAKAQEPFFTTKGVGKGTGLGLPMVRGVAEQTGGAFRLSSAPGQGTRAEIWLPVANAGSSVDQAHAATERDDPETTRPIAVLVVDDDPLVLENTSAMLDDCGHHVIEARSGEEALDILSRARRIDLVVSDHGMPGMTGMELLSHIRALRPELPFILASGFAELPNAPLVEVVRLAKPYDQAALRVAIVAALKSAEASDTEAFSGSNWSARETSGIAALDSATLSTSTRPAPGPKCDGHL